jgi:hypothetical protein
MYTWLTAFDIFSFYTRLPICVSTLLTSKMCSFAVLQIIPAFLIVVVSIASGNFMYLLPALVQCLFCFCLCPCSHGLPDRPFTKCVVALMRRCCLCISQHSVQL